MVEYIGDYEQYTTIYKIKREFEETNELINELKNKQNNLKKEIILELGSYLYILFLKVRLNNKKSVNKNIQE